MSCRSITRLAAAALCVLLAACTGPTPYQAATDRDGYAENLLEENRYRVTFAGNTKTPREVVEDYLLYRAAEVTLESGNDWFRVAERDTEANTRFRGFSSGFGRFGFGHFRRFGFVGFRSGFGFGAGTFSAIPKTRYQAFADIIVLSGTKPADDATAYDARSVIEALGPRIQRPVPE